MSRNSLVRKAVTIDKFISQLGLTPNERSKLVADRIMIDKYISTSSCVLEICARASVSLFIEKRKDEDAKHVVLDNDVGDKQRLKELIDMNNMSLEIIPMEEFIDIYSYDSVVIEESEGELAEVLCDLPLENIKIIITSERKTDDCDDKEVRDFMEVSGFTQVEVVAESAGTDKERKVTVYVKKEENPAEEEPAEEAKDEEQAEEEPTEEEPAEEAKEEEQAEEAEEAKEEEQSEEEPTEEAEEAEEEEQAEEETTEEAEEAEEEEQAEEAEEAKEEEQAEEEPTEEAKEAEEEEQAEEEKEEEQQAEEEPAEEAKEEEQQSEEAEESKEEDIDEEDIIAVIAGIACSIDVVCMD